MDEVLIVGAGAAGLAAARELAVAGKQVMLLEARDRVGGRIYTYRDDGSRLPIELGAEFVHGKHPDLMRVLDGAGIPFCDVTNRHWYFENGMVGTSHEFWNKLTAVMDMLSVDQPDQTLKDFLATLPDDEASRQSKAIATRYVQGFHAARINRIGVHGLIKANEAEDEIEGNNGFRIPGGYDLVTQTLHDEAIAAGAVVRLNTIVKTVTWSANGVAVSCVSNGTTETFEASCVLITLPLAVLKEGAQRPKSNVQSPTRNDQSQPNNRTAGVLARTLDSAAVSFVPDLPEEKQTAIRELQMGQVVHLTLRFRERFWEKLPSSEKADLANLGFIHFPEAPLPTWWTLLHIRAPLLVGWAGGPSAERFTSMPTEELVSEGLKSLQIIFRLSESDLRKQLVSSHVHDWGADPFARGGYSYVPVNGLKLQETLAEPVRAPESKTKVLYFAGEATSVGHIGTVHGAIASGLRAAKEILK